MDFLSTCPHRKSILMHSLVQRATRTLKAIVWKCYGIDCFLVQLAGIPESSPRKRCTQSCAREIIDNCANKKSLFTYLFNAYDTGGAIELEQSSILTLRRFHPKVTREKCSYKERMLLKSLELECAMLTCPQLIIGFGGKKLILEHVGALNKFPKAGYIKRPCHPTNHWVGCVTGRTRICSATKTALCFRQHF